MSSLTHHPLRLTNRHDLFLPEEPVPPEQRFQRETLDIRVGEILSAEPIEGADKLRKEKGLKIQVVSAISEGLFRNQPADYQKEVLPDDIPRFGLTAGLPTTIEGLTGPNGKAVGMDSFGYSGPYTVLDEKFGFTGDAVFKEVCNFMKI